MDPPAPRPSLVERLTTGARISLHAWRGEFREEIGKITANPRKRAIAASVAAAVLLGIGVAGWIGLGKQSPIASSQAAPAHPAQPEIARLSARLTVSDTIERLALALPSEAALASVEVDKDGGFAIEVELPDPERLRAALAADPVLRGLRQVSQMSGDNGPRVRLFAPATPAGNGVVNALAAGDRLVQKLRRTAARTGTLIEAAEPARRADPGGGIRAGKGAARLRRRDRDWRAANPLRALADRAFARGRRRDAAGGGCRRHPATLAPIAHPDDASAGRGAQPAAVHRTFDRTRAV
jgi:hypothetical protein